MLKTYLLVTVGGGLGSAVRLFMTTWLPSSLMGLPLPVMFINIIGSFAIGYLAQIIAKYGLSSGFRDFFLIGFLGGLTTFSSFSLTYVSLLKKSQFVWSSAYACLSVLLAFFCCLIGMKLAR